MSMAMQLSRGMQKRRGSRGKQEENIRQKGSSSNGEADNGTRRSPTPATELPRKDDTSRTTRKGESELDRALRVMKKTKREKAASDTAKAEAGPGVAKDVVLGTSVVRVGRDDKRNGSTAPQDDERVTS
jgi:hypothetical protein